MNRILAIAISALFLSGCIAEWKNPKGPQRWSGQAGNPSPEYNPGPVSGGRQ